MGIGFDEETQGEPFHVSLACASGTRAARNGRCSSEVVFASSPPAAGESRVGGERTANAGPLPGRLLDPTTTTSNPAQTAPPTQSSNPIRAPASARLGPQPRRRCRRRRPHLSAPVISPIPFSAQPRPHGAAFAPSCTWRSTSSPHRRPFTCHLHPPHSPRRPKFTAPASDEPIHRSAPRERKQAQRAWVVGTRRGADRRLSGASLPSYSIYPYCVNR